MPKKNGYILQINKNMKIDHFDRPLPQSILKLAQTDSVCSPTQFLVGVHKR